MVHGHPVKYRAKNLAGACHGFLRKFLELIVHHTAVLFDTERWALEFVPYGIRVNTVSPG